MVKEPMRQGKRLLSFLLAALLLLGTLTTSTVSAAISAGKTGTSKVVMLGKGKDGKSYSNPHHSYGGQFKYVVTSGGKDYTGYCMEPDKDFSSGNKYTVKNYKKSRAYKALNANRQRVLALVMLYGYNQGKSAPYGNANDYYAATQTMVWQAVTGKLTVSDAGKVSNSTSGDYNLIKGHSYAVKCYNKMKKQIGDHVKGASFTKATKGSAKTYTMTYSYRTKKWSVTLTDTKKVNYLKKLSGTTSGLSMSRSGYKYTFSASKAGTYTATLGNNIKTGTSQALVVMEGGSSANQAVVMGATDETKFYVKLKTEAAGTARIVKTSDNGVVQGFRFRITNSSNGYSGTFTTNASGVITASLQPGTYKVEEVLTQAQINAGYIAPAPVNVTVKAGQTATVNRHNQIKTVPKKGGLRVLKTTTDGGPVEGFQFRVEREAEGDSKTLTAQQVLDLANPQLIGLENYELGEWKVEESDLVKLNAAAKEGKTGTYELQLTNQANLKESAAGEAEEATDGTGAPAEAATANTEQPESISLEVTVTVTLCHVDEQAKAAEPQSTEQVSYKNFGWAGSATKFEQLLTTDEDGYAELRDLDFGTYTVTEVMNEEQSERYHQPVSQTVVLSEENADATVTVSFKNEAKTGDLLIKKTSDDGKVANVPMTITGTTAWGEEIEPISQVTGADGTLPVKDLAAGTYTVTETLDPEIYLPQEPQTVTITGEETEPIEVHFHNVPYTDVEISKESETTGEELPGAHLQIIDKETGKVVEEWTSTTEPHVVKKLIPGKEYILHEDLAPLGYSCAQDITFTAGGDRKVVMVDEINKLFITKIDKDTGKYLPGAEFEVKDKETGKVVASFTTPKAENKDSVVYTEVTGLIEGKEYIIHETKAPKGYALAKEDKTITFKNKMEVAIANTKEGIVIIEDDDEINRATGHTVQTGDDFPYEVYFLILSISAALGGIALLCRKKLGTDA